MKPRRLSGPVMGMQGSVVRQKTLSHNTLLWHLPLATCLSFQGTMAIAQWWHCVDLSVNKGTRRIRNVGWTRQRSETATPCITASEHEPQDSHLKSAAESRHFPCVDAVGHGVECCISHQYIVLVGRSAPSQKHFAKALELKRFFEEAAAPNVECVEVKHRSLLTLCQAIHTFRC